jgi:hypothetical protein
MDGVNGTVRAGRIRTICLIGAGLIPLCLALAGTSAVPEGRKLASHKVLPPLAFRQYSVNLRETAPTARIVAPFAFWNRGESPLTITKLEPSCGCLAPRLLGNRKEYPPGVQGLFEVQVETARETPGPHTYSIRVHYTDGEQQLSEVVTFRCEIPSRTVQVSPPELYFYQLSASPISQTLRVQDFRGKDLNIVSATSRSPHLTVKVGERETDENGIPFTLIHVEVGADVPPGSHHNVISIRTDDPDFPLVTVPVFLQGKPQSVQLTSGTSLPQHPKEATHQNSGRETTDQAESASARRPDEETRDE